MGGDEHTLNTVVVVEPHTGKAEGCASAPAGTAISFDIPGVGGAPADVTAKFGPANRTSGGISTMPACSQMLL
jgi:hypothetical protein